MFPYPISQQIMPGKASDLYTGIANINCQIHPIRCCLMLEMAHTGFHHCHTMCITKINAVLVANGAARLNDRCNPRLMRDFHTIREWEKCIGSHYGTFQAKTKSSCFDNGLAERIDPGGLTAGNTEKLLTPRQYDRI